MLYIGDVPIEGSYHGSALIHRLLSNFPSDHLRIVEVIQNSQPERRLKDVRYFNIGAKWRRLLNTRLHRWVASVICLTNSWWLPALKSCAEDFESEAVLTVVHGYSWLLAARYARRHGLPLHLIIHDDWVRSLHLPWVMMRWLERRFASVYRGASSRLCVSPSLAQQFQSSYGVAGVVLYPARGKDCPIFDDPPARLEKISSTFVAAYAGASLRAEGNRGPLADVAKALIPIGGRLLIYGPYSADDLKSMELDLPNVDLKGLVPSSELIVMLREEAHLLIAQMSFLAEDSYLMATCFPSRLADYTAVGIPILIYAPPSSSAVRWAQENAGAAIVIHRRDVASIQKLVQELSTNADLRWSLGSRALEVGQKYFSEQTAWLMLRQSLNPNAS